MTQSALLAQIVLSINTLDDKVQQLQDSRSFLQNGEHASATYHDFTSIPMVTSAILGRNSVPSIAVDHSPPASSLSATVPSTVPLNVHFYIPRLVDRFYTGREVLAVQLRDWLLPCLDHTQNLGIKNQQTQQNRFVIYGDAGSGKTQFCCKFAEENRDR
jgi:hypothetical protein